MKRRNFAMLSSWYSPNSLDRPFASWERGLNENFNGLLRQYLPQKQPIANMMDEEIKMIENRLNNRPRKRLAFRTPAEVFH